jgi:hypothetical protein
MVWSIPICLIEPLFRARVQRHSIGCKAQNNWTHVEIALGNWSYWQYTGYTFKEQSYMCNCAVNKQVHAHNARSNNYHDYVYNLELCNSKPSVVNVVYNTKNPQLSGLCPSPRIPNTRKPNILETGSVSEIFFIVFRFPDNGKNPVILGLYLLQ